MLCLSLMLVGIALIGNMGWVRAKMCDIKLCNYEGICETTADGQQVRCQCVSVYTGDKCEYLFNWCYRAPCANNGVCR